jgi:regulation of enolase protein 1 (concanavalin A-like superfamily)
MEYDVDEALRDLLVAKDVSLPPLPDLPPRLSKPPAVDPLMGWHATDIAGALRGGQKVRGPDAMDIYGGGRDIWQRTDQCRFVWQRVAGDFDFSATLDGLDETHPYAKAGLMVRATLEPSSQMAMIGLTPHARIEVISRSADRANSNHQVLDRMAFPGARLRLRRAGDRITMAYGTSEADWRLARNVKLPGFGDEAFLGLAVVSHDNRQLARAKFTKIAPVDGQPVSPAELAELGLWVPISTPPAREAVPGWCATDVGEALPGGQQVRSASELAIYAGGADIWGARDQFRFLWREVRGDFELSALVDSLAYTHDNAKAGLMIRGGQEPDAPFVMIGVLPDGQVEELHRTTRGTAVAAKWFARSALSGLRLRLAREGDTIRTSFACTDRAWQAGSIYKLPALSGDDVLVGVAALSHDNMQLTEAVFNDLKLEP